MSAWIALSVDALRDALGRRSLLVAGVASALVALAVNRCTGCDASVTLQGQSVARGDLAALTALVSFGLLALWAYAMAALLASDGLVTALEDGTAESVLARPVSRDTLCLARLAGVLVGALSVVVPLFALAAVLVHVRQGFDLAPAAAATSLVVLGSWSAAAFSMALSLVLLRPGTMLAMTVAGLVVCGAELGVWLGQDPGGVFGWLGRMGPGWLSGPLAPLAPWLAPSALPAPPPLALLRAAGWGIVATGTLLALFRRREL